jgi:hypothetical protein
MMVALSEAGAILMGNDHLAYKVGLRDIRIDFFRGLALYMILVDHIYADPISKFTYQNFGFSDAAEIFVFLSGVSCGIVYSRVLVRRGWTSLTFAITRRATLIYVYYVLASIATILLLDAASDALKNAGIINRTFLVLHDDPFSGIWSTIFLISPPELPGILVLYLVLTLIVIPLFLIGAMHRAALTLAASAFIWMIAQFYPGLAPRLADHSYFNPLAWQFLFSIGMFVGLKYDSNWSELRSTQIFKWLLFAALAIVIASFLYRFSLVLSSKFQLDLDWFGISKIAYVHTLENQFAIHIKDAVQMKENLSVVRLLHFLSVALLVATYLKSSNPIFRWSGAVLVTRAGRCSLEIFSMATILSVALGIIVVLDRASILEKLVLDGAAILFMALTAVALTEFRLKRQRVIGPATLPLKLIRDEYESRPGR